MTVANFRRIADNLDFFRCPVSHQALKSVGETLISADGSRAYNASDAGVPLFAIEFSSAEGKVQRAHYDRVARAYVANLTYPHTQEYIAYLDGMLRDTVGSRPLGATAEICCGTGEALRIFKHDVGAYVGVDISPEMLSVAIQSHPETATMFAQGDATMMPLASGAFDTVFMLGGIHHVNDRARLFAEIFRILKPGGMFFFREPLNDFFLWWAIRKVIYRLSPQLDHNTERPLRNDETVPPLMQAGFGDIRWKPVGFLGFCLLMNSHVLVFNRLFRFIPGIRQITRAFTKLDTLCMKIGGIKKAGLLVIGAARRPL